MAETFELALTVDGEPRRVAIEARETLADVLRERLGVFGVRIGCGEGHCGACTVQIDGATARACTVLAAQAEGATIRTVEGLAPPGAPLHPLQRAFIEEHAVQCGFCTGGMLMAAEELLREQPDADDDAIRDALAGNLCRCTGYQGILRAVRRARDAARDAR
jgi:aerobic-type carbon monoxide dehydrogenase small subunit (CoxS/CutS family)